MEQLLTHMLPILEVADDCIVSKMGDVTVAFELTKPELFTLGEEGFETLHQAFVRAIRILPQYTVIHMQDWFTETSYQARIGEGMSFLAQASERHFDGRPWMDHRSWLFLTRKPPGRRPVNSLSSSLLRKHLVPEDTLRDGARQEFMDTASQFHRILADTGLIGLRQLTTAEIVSQRQGGGIIEQYCSLCGLKGPHQLRDLSFEDGIKIGDQYCQLFTLADAGDLPDSCGPRMVYDRYSTDKTKFPTGFANVLGPLLPCNHLYNQYIFLDDPSAILKKFETKRQRLHTLSNYSRGNAIARDALNEFLNEAVGQSRMPVKAHFNVLAWTDNPHQLKEIKNRVSSAMAQMQAASHLETVGAAQIWWAGIPGNAADLPVNETFDTFAEQACCFLSLETNYRSSESPTTIRFGDRLTGKPVELDLFVEPLRLGEIKNRGVLVCGSSGGGKSMLCNHIFRSLYDQGGHIMIVDIGGSYKGLCELVGGYYFTYTEAAPIRFNPFWLSAGESLDIEKKESLKALLVALWKEEHENLDRAEYVAISNALEKYYGWLRGGTGVFPCFNTFYEWLRTDYAQLLRQEKVKEQDFDIDNFLYVLRPYYRGGEFDYLLNAEENLDLLRERFVVFELDNIKDHPILLPVVSVIITELVISKMRKIPSVLKAFVIEEAWKPMMRSGMAEFIKYSFKTLRKYNGIPVVVSQEIDDLVSSPIIKDAIVNNSDIKILMDMRKWVQKFDALQATLGMSEKRKVQLFSVNRANEPGRRYREFYLELGGEYSRVLRYEPSPEEYYTYTTDQGEKARVMEYAAKYGGMQKGIEELVAELNHRR